MLKRSLFSIFHGDNTSDSVFSIFFTSYSVFSIFNVRLRVFHILYSVFSIFYTPCFPYFVLRVFHILYSVFSIFCTPCFPYFILRVFHFLTSHSGAPTPRLRLRNSDSGTPAPCFPFNQNFMASLKNSRGLVASIYSLTTFARSTRDELAICLK